MVLRIDYKASGNADDTRQSNRGRLAGTKPAARASYRLADKFIKSPLACLATLATLPRLAKAATSFHDAKADVFVTMGVLNGCKHATNPWSGLSKACGLTAVDSPANVSLLPLPALYDGQGCQERPYVSNISSTTAQCIIEYFENIALENSPGAVAGERKAEAIVLIAVGCSLIGISAGRAGCALYRKYQQNVASKQPQNAQPVSEQSPSEAAWDTGSQA